MRTLKRRKDAKRRLRRPAKLSPELREYLAFIGTRGGEASRRWLSRSHAKEMVAIREAKRRAAGEGNLEFALKRIPLSKYQPTPIRPITRARRMVGTLGPDSV